MKSLKFSDPLPEQILAREKSATWRIQDTKNILIGDRLSLCNSSGVEFAKAKVVFVVEKMFGELTEEDREGHEKYDSDEEMYRVYSGYYGFKVDGKTIVKIIKFELM